MALDNVQVVSPGGSMLPPAIPFRTEAGTLAISAGEPVKIGGTGNHYVVRSATAEPVTTDATFVGIASSNSTQTASLDGSVDVQLPIRGMIFQAKALDPLTIDTAAELLAVVNTKVVFNRTAGVYTVDTAVVGATFGLIILGGDIVNGTVTFVVRDTVQFLSV